MTFEIKISHSRPQTICAKNQVVSLLCFDMKKQTKKLTYLLLTVVVEIGTRIKLEKSDLIHFVFFLTESKGHC